MNTTVSIIIPCYNALDYIEECLLSVCQQTLKDIEVVIIDDGSTDETLKFIETFRNEKAQHIDFKIISQKNSGVGKARNLGIKEATGKFVCFMDPDDFYPSTTVLNELYEEARKNNVFICGGSFSRYLQKSKKLITNFSADYSNYTFTKPELIKYKDYQYNYGFHRFIYDRQFLLENNLFFPSLSRYQDPIFMVNAFHKAEFFYAIPEITYCYRKEHRTTTQTFNQTNKILDAFLGMDELLRFSIKNEYLLLHNFVLNQQKEHIVALTKILDSKFCLKKRNLNIYEKLSKLWPF